VFYPDMGCKYTKEMYNDDHGIIEEVSKKKKRKSKK